MHLSFGIENARRVGADAIGPGLRELEAKHPLIGEVRGEGVFWAMELVADRETREPVGADVIGKLKKELTSAYGKYFEEPVIQVIPKEIRSLKVFIMGEVAKPGVYSLNDSMTILQLISLAGGLNPWADKRNIVLIGKEPLPSGEADKRVIDLKKVFDPRAKIRIPELRPGDQVIVK